MLRICIPMKKFVKNIKNNDNKINNNKNKNDNNVRTFCHINIINVL